MSEHLQAVMAEMERQGMRPRLLDVDGVSVASGYDPRTTWDVVVDLPGNGLAYVLREGVGQVRVPEHLAADALREDIRCLDWWEDKCREREAAVSRELFGSASQSRGW